MDEPKKRGLALSGGGFRATLFHLGVIRCLYDAERLDPDNKALSGITHITSVSGGSILAAHLVLNWERYTGDEESFCSAAAEIISFIRMDIRGRILRRIPLLFPVFWMSILLRRTPFLDENTFRWWTKVSTTDLLQRYYSKHLFKHKKLFDLKAPPGKKRPAIYLLATSIDDAHQAYFTAKGFRVGDSKLYPCPTQDLGLAVAASSAFPGMFPPVAFQPSINKPIFKLMDGGVFDNLGVRKFWNLMQQDKINFDEIIVSDASIEFKPPSKRSFLEPFTTPLRAADILFKRVYDFEKGSAEQVGEETDKCSFRFVRLLEELDTDNDDLALMSDYQLGLFFTRTDLDLFADIEIAALIRHGYCVARTKLDNMKPCDGPTKSVWNPVLGTKDKLTLDMINRLNDDSSRIVQTLNKSSVRKFRFISFTDWVSYLTLIILVMIFGYVVRIDRLLDTLANSDSINVNLPLSHSVDEKLLTLRMAESKNNYRNILLERKVGGDDGNGFAADSKKLTNNELRQVPLETWTTSEVAYALTKAGNLNREEKDFLVRSLDDRFKPSSAKRKTDWRPEIGGWVTRPSEEHFQAEPALWTLAAICALLQTDGIEDNSRKNLLARTEQIQNYLSKNQFLVWQPEGLAFNVLANQKVPESHSAYTTSLALLALIEMRKLSLTWNNAPADQMISGILNWLDNNYSSSEPKGWVSIHDDMDIPSVDEAVNLQILGIMIDAYTELGLDVPDNLRSRTSHHLSVIEKSSMSDSSARVWRLTTTKPDELTNDEVRITFISRPWAIRLCRRWLKSLSNSATTDEKDKVIKMLDQFTGDLSDTEQYDKQSFTFRSVEMLIALS